MIKALIIAQYPIEPGNIKGGVEAVSVNLVNGFIPVSGIDLKILTLDRNIKEDQTRMLAEHISVHHIAYRKNKSAKFELFFHFRKRIKEFISTYHPDVIHIQGNGSKLLLTYKVDKEKIVITQHGILIEELKSQSSLRSKLNFLLNIYIEFLMMPNIRNFVCISDYNRKILKQKNLTKSKLTLIYNPVNPAFFNIPKNDTPVNRLIYIGGIMKRKGLLDLLKALKVLIGQNINFHLDVVGGTVEPVYAQQINEFILNNQLTKNVALHGWISQDEIVKCYKNVQILVLPSYQETLPVCISEAMAAGKIVVATTVGGISEMIENEKTGFLYKKGDIDALTKILSRVYLNDSLYVSIGKQAKVDAHRKYNPVVVANQTLNLYRNMALHNTRSSLLLEDK